MKKFLFLFVCLTACTVIFAQNEQKNGDNMAAGGNFTGAAMMYRLCLEKEEECLIKLIHLLYDGKIEPQYADELFQLTLPCAQHGNAEAQYFLGMMYLHGKGGVRQNLAEASQWLYRRAGNGNADEWNDLAKIFVELGGGDSYTKAFSLLKKSAESNNASGMCSLGYMYEKGLGTIKDYAEAVRLYTLSAELGYAPAQYNLGLMYEFGTGVKQNKKEAEKWYKRSAELGFRLAEKRLSN